MKRGYTAPLYELAPTNGRDANSQAAYYGYASAGDLASSLPPKAKLIDIGAGTSDFGRVIAAARWDVEVTCFDLRYGNANILQQAAGDNPPPNINFVAGDILKIEETDLALNGFDRAFSSRLIQHIELEDRVLARAALVNIGRLLKADGSMIVVGKPYQLWRDRLFRRQVAVTITKKELRDNPDFVLEQAIAMVRLPDIHRWRTRIHNVHATAYFGQPQCRRPDEKGRVLFMHGEIWDPAQQAFIPRRSMRGHLVYAGFQRRILADPLPRRAKK